MVLLVQTDPATGRMTAACLGDFDVSDLWTEIDPGQIDAGAFVSAHQDWRLQDGSLVYDPLPAPAPPMPDSASRLGLMRALREIGKWDAVKAAIASSADAQEEWDLAISIKREDPLTAGIIGALGLTSADVDNLLIRAAALTS